MSSAPSTSRSAKRRARSLTSPTTMRLGWRLSSRALPSRRNSGLKMRLSVPSLSRSPLVKPTGIVDLTTMTASGLVAMTSAMTPSTEEVSK